MTNHCSEVDRVNLDEHAAFEARLEFIGKFPRLAPLMYHLTPNTEPRSVEEWLLVIEQELNYAKRKQILKYMHTDLFNS